MPLKFGFVAQNIVDRGKISWDEINRIKKWVETRPDLPKYTAEQIVCFHLACDRDEEATKVTLISFNTIRNGCTQLFSKRHLENPNLKKALSVVNFSIFPKLTEDGCAIIFNQFINTDYSLYDVAEHMKVTLMVLDAAIYDYPPNGFILIVDMEGMSIMHLTRLKLNIVKTTADYLQSALPVKLKNIHFTNATFFVDKLLKLIKQFLSENVIKLIFCHPKSSMDNFRNTFISKKYLPLELGGDLPSIKILNQNTIQKLTSIQSHFDDEEKQRQGVKI